MKSYCIKCKKEMEMKAEKVTINNRKHEKKVEGKCWDCGEYLCRILLVANSKK